MKRTRFQYEYRQGTSLLHKKIGECLRDSVIFQSYQIYQEYPVVRVNTRYEDTSHHFDWVIPDLFIVIEAHGKQHYEATDFSGKSEDGGISEFKALRARDVAKKQAAIEAGWTYIEVPYSDMSKITDEYIWALYRANMNEQEIVNNESMDTNESIQKERSRRVRQEYIQSERHQEELERHREYRKAQYDRAKERRSLVSGSDD